MCLLNFLNFNYYFVESTTLDLNVTEWSCPSLLYQVFHRVHLNNLV
jgi:hypothetical protein